ncbi:MAG: deoxyribodipyrimidine photo-lyase [Melioribacteraceae bacterium]|nr:deoxyribodipyrimidine photo-lyase [Melioribacteraceae bacterium]
MNFIMLEKRIKSENNRNYENGPVVYWMQRDQRVNDNWALIYAQQQAVKNKTYVIVAFCLVNEFLEAAFRHYDFMLKGLREVQNSLEQFNIPFKLLIGNPEEKIPNFVSELNAGMLISDFNPLKIITGWKKKISSKVSIPFITVDAHNIIPAWVVSEKEEFAAYTIRPKINRLVDEYLCDYPLIEKQSYKKNRLIENDWNTAQNSLRIDFSIKQADWIKPGEAAALEMLQIFLNDKLDAYNTERNDPTKDAVSNLSPYLHFGQISAQRIALDTQAFIEYPESQRSFLEELIVRRELSDNYCYYNEHYDSFEGFKEWAKDTLNKHRNDKREYLYTREEFENAATHDDLWNAAQIQMVTSGKMHGYMRMYWAKKILEWTNSPEEALAVAIYLNDKYQLDGRDPNGYVGAAWSIGGIHDRAWTERPVFGKIRYMNYNGCKRKFDVNKYINSWLKF